MKRKILTDNERLVAVSVLGALVAWGLIALWSCV